ncbi:hypothetical protein [Nonlabens xiamenensis]|uniref:hypothetical protein n=1 Tax=Nonlabens xiamenensis TaxID=2341043 RepID=UPI0013DDAFA9|nr:hypothetical protein [Nonlabens xiamenensis]
MYTTAYVYGRKGKQRVIEEITQNAQGTKVNHFIYTYRDGKLEAREELGQEKVTYTYEYDNQSN